MSRLAFAVLSLGGLLLTATACQDAETPTSSSSPPSLAAAPGAIPGRYIVVFRPDEADAPGLARQLVAQHGGTLLFTYQYAIRGFAASLPAAAVDALSRNPRVAYIEADQIATAIASGTESPTPSWGLDRVDARSGLDNSYSWATDGSGVTAYIIDTGILTTHTDFLTGLVKRATSGFDFVDNDTDATDCHGHGTHVAATVGGTKYGIAKGVNLVAVRVLDCKGSGTFAGVIAGVDWVTKNHPPLAVANMSLGGGLSQSLNDAVSGSIASGVTYGVAAGNGNRAGIPQDACGGSPSSTPAAITVGATTQTDREASFSNYGTCVDILAPGVGITSAWYTSTTATNTISGTSMATPHVVGAAALYRSGHTTASAAEVANALASNATSGAITLNSTTKGTPNLLLYTAFGGTAPPASTPPAASFTVDACPDRVCGFDGSASTDPGGSITQYDWNFGDGQTASSTTATTSHTYGGSATSFTVTLTVTDNGSLTNSTSQTVSVPPPASTGITLTATGFKVKGVQNVRLNWSGAAGGNIDVFRDSGKVTNTANDGEYVDNIGVKGGGRTYVYQVCEAGTATCSAEQTVVF